MNPDGDLAARFARLPEDRRAALLARLAAGRESEEPVASVQQEQLWLVDQADPDGAPNNLAYVWSLDGDLDSAALFAALRGVVERQDALRSTFHPGPVVRVETRPLADDAWYSSVDLRAETDPEAAAEALAHGLAGHRFDMEAGPLFLACLLRLPGDRHRLLWVVHHAVWDAASVGVFLADLAAGYAAALSGEPAPAPPPVTYGRYAARQRRELRGPGTEGLRDWWREQLAGAVPTEIPGDRARPAVRTFRGAAVDLPLADAAVTARLRALAREERATLFHAVVAGFTALLGRWTGTDEVVFGTPSGARPEAKLEKLVGFFVTMVTLRCPYDGDRSFRGSLSAARDAVLDALDHQGLPFAEVVAAVNPPRDAARSPLFQVELAYEADAAAALDVELPGVRLAHRRLHDGGSRFDASVVVREDAGELTVTVEYNPDLYDEATVVGLARAFGALLEAAAAEPDAALAGLPMIGEADAAVLLELGEGERSPGPPYPTVVDAILGRDPDLPATSYQGRTRTYGDVVAAARRVAGALLAAGVAPGDRVVVAVPRDDDAILALLGVHLAGAAYVPVDLGAPDEWLRAQCADAGAVVALAGDDPTAARMAGLGAGVPLLLADALAAPDPGSLPPCDPSRLAYVLYTSGTTGRPKGVAVEHASLAWFSHEIGRAYRMEPGERVLAFARLTFDVSVFEIFSSLANGATVCVADDAARGDHELLQQVLAGERVTVAELPPALLPLLHPDGLPDLRLVSVGGEAFPGTLVGPWTAGGREFWNGYGPTEATVAVTLMHCVDEGPAMPPIGRPLPGHRAYVLDDQLRLVPRGAPGELCVAGPDLARGYLGDPGRTAVAFPPDPYRPGERLYRTGDLVRWRGDGTLQFLGRGDRQVKVRGFRIELAEVEGVLASHPGVASALAGVADLPGAVPALVAAVIPRDTGAHPDPAEVLALARERLPAHAVPARLLVVDELPRTRSSKVDRETLTALVASAPGLVVEAEAPSGPTEAAILAEVLAPALGLAAVPRHAGFFELGGNSLQATLVVAQLRRRFGVPFTVGDFFRAPSAAAMAVLVDERRSALAETANP